MIDYKKSYDEILAAKFSYLIGKEDIQLPFFRGYFLGKSEVFIFKISFFLNMINTIHFMTSLYTMLILKMKILSMLY